MTIAEAYEEIQPLDAEILLSALLEKDRAWILAHNEYVLTAAEEQKFHAWARERKRGMPIAYLRGWQPFYTRDFFVSQDVLIPRPSTETLLEQALAMIGQTTMNVRRADTGISILSHKIRSGIPKCIVDVGTGSGCVAVTLVCEMPALHCFATDISPSALHIALQNAQKFSVDGRIEFRLGSLLQPVKDICEPFLLVSNPPYISSSHILDSTVASFEPYEALFAGKDGLDVLLPLVKEAMCNSYCTGVVLECCDRQVQPLQSILNARPT